MKRPFVYINMAMTVDGKITSAAREYPRLTSRHDRDTMDRLRAEADAMLVGARTIRDDNPTLHVRSTEMQAYRKSLGKPEPILKVVVSASLDLDLSEPVLRRHVRLRSASSPRSTNLRNRIASPGIESHGPRSGASARNASTSRNFCPACRNAVSSGCWSKAEAS